jgi:hypothetical protein
MFDFTIKNRDTNLNITWADLSGFLYYDLYLQIFPPLENQDIIWELRNTPPEKFSMQISHYLSKTKVQYGIS